MSARASLARAMSAYAAAALFALPLWWMIATSFTPPGEYVATTLSLWPDAPTLDHYRALLTGRVVRQVANSAAVALGTVAVALAIAFPAAYALARLRFPARLDVAFLAFVLLLKLTPPIVLAVPLFQVLRALGLIDQLGGLVLVYQVHALPLAIWLLLGFVREVPWAYEEAAMIDGAGLVRRLTTIVLPIVRPGLFATAILVFMASWNEFLYALLFIQTPSKFPLPTFIATRITEDETLWGQLMAIGVIACLPVLAGLGAVQRHLTRGVQGGLTG